ncbi:NTP transferase domain-containing protein [Cesiribacter sp. SM1]|uniref:nucleotidyltransferase family protein n=1 Tax=Cesiribacter sp. SM1 TaxID=2861196 RepID=UPI001CD4A790|nr:nucleotidyltransferase family protein [Cesiribacter sp. SM1]
MKVCGLILAAGGSSRLGRAKQLLQQQGKSLLALSIETALAAGLDPVYVVLGARQEQILDEISHLPVKIISNQEWQEGIGSSIRIGISHIEAEESYDAVVILLCDQLLITADHIKSLVALYQSSHKPIVATAYGAQSGVPALFSHSYFHLLLALQGDTGARKIIAQHQQNAHVVNFEAAALDIDTAEDARGAGLS